MTRVLRWGKDWVKVLAQDYKASAEGVVAFCREHPLKAARNGAIFGVLGWLAHTNPTEAEYHNHITRREGELRMIPAFCRSSRSTGHVGRAAEAKQTGSLAYTDCLFFSVATVQPRPIAMQSYLANRDNFAEWLDAAADRVVEVPIGGRFPMMERCMVDCDVFDGEAVQ